MTGGYVGANSATTEPVLVDISGGTIGSFRNSAGLLLEMSGGRILDGVSGGRLLPGEGRLDLRRHVFRKMLRRKLDHRRRFQRKCQ